MKRISIWRAESFSDRISRCRMKPPPENRMRELFDEVAGKSPLDPEEAVRRTTRGPQRKRFYAQAAVTETADGFAITLDDKPVRTPSGRPLAAPNREIAEAIAAEWDAQTGFHRSADHAADAALPTASSTPWSIGSTPSPTTSRNISSPTCCSTAPVIPRRWSRARRALGSGAVLGRGYARRAFHSRRGHRACAPARSRDPGGARGAAIGSLVDRGPACGHDADRLGAAGAGAVPWRARPTRSGPPRMSTRTGTASNGAWTRKSRRAAPRGWSISRPRRILEALNPGVG